MQLFSSTYMLIRDGVFYCIRVWQWQLQCLATTNLIPFRNESLETGSEQQQSYLWVWCETQVPWKFVSTGVFIQD